jgi:hypothetical protein
MNGVDERMNERRPIVDRCKTLILREGGGGSEGKGKGAGEGE